MLMLLLFTIGYFVYFYLLTSALFGIKSLGLYTTHLIVSFLYIILAVKLFPSKKSCRNKGHKRVKISKQSRKVKVGNTQDIKDVKDIKFFDLAFPVWVTWKNGQLLYPGFIGSHNESSNTFFIHYCDGDVDEQFPASGTFVPRFGIYANNPPRGDLFKPTLEEIKTFPKYLSRRLLNLYAVEDNEDFHDLPDLVDASDIRSSTSSASDCSDASEESNVKLRKPVESPVTSATNLLTSLEDQYKSLKQEVRNHPDEIIFKSNDIRVFQSFQGKLEKFKTDDVENNQYLIKYIKSHDSWFLSKRCLSDIFKTRLIRDIGLLKTSIGFVRFIHRLFPQCRQNKKIQVICLGGGYNNDVAIQTSILLSFASSNISVDCITDRDICNQRVDITDCTFHKDSASKWIEKQFKLKSICESKQESTSDNLENVVVLNWFDKENKTIIDYKQLVNKLRRIFPNANLHILSDCSAMSVISKSSVQDTNGLEHEMFIPGFTVGLIEDDETWNTWAYYGYSPWNQSGAAKLESHCERQKNKIRRNQLLKDEATLF